MVVDSTGVTVPLDSVLGRPHPAGEQTQTDADSAVTRDPDGQIPPPVQETGGSSCIDINKADERELTSLKGIGPVLAAQVVAHRELKGPFTRKEDLLGVKGIGPAKLAKIEGRICF
jgi:competence protein ComEA